jgi:hypothetical protein
MHVQIAGANGIELHQHVATFPLLVNAVVTALNDGPPTPTSAKELHLA